MLKSAAYLRASTAEQDAHRARARLDAFAQEHGFPIAAWYVENESGAKLSRPELFRLLADCQPGDVLLTEQVDRLSRLTEPDWRQLRAEIEAKQVRIVALDLPTSWGLTEPSDDFTGRMFAAVNAMMLDVLAAVARKDYEDRRRRKAEGIGSEESERAEGAAAAKRLLDADSVLPLIQAGQASFVEPDGGEPLPGFTFHPTPGHSTNHMSIGLRFGDGYGLFSGDVMHHPIQVCCPEWNSVFSEDTGRGRASRDWALNHMADTRALVFSSHFPGSSAGRVTRGTDGFRWAFA